MILIYVFVIFLCLKPIKAASLYGGFQSSIYLKCETLLEVFFIDSILNSTLNSTLNLALNCNCVTLHLILLFPSDITESPSTTLTMTTVTRFTSLSLNLFEDSKSARKLITLTLPSLDIHHR